MQGPQQRCMRQPPATERLLYPVRRRICRIKTFQHRFPLKPNQRAVCSGPPDKGSLSRSSAGKSPAVLELGNVSRRSSSPLAFASPVSRSMQHDLCTFQEDTTLPSHPHPAPEGTSAAPCLPLGRSARALVVGKRRFWPLLSIFVGVASLQLPRCLFVCVVSSVLPLKPSVHCCCRVWCSRHAAMASLPPLSVQRAVIVGFCVVFAAWQVAKCMCLCVCVCVCGPNSPRCCSFRRRW